MTLLGELIGGWRSRPTSKHSLAKLRPNPFLHVDETYIHNPHTNKSLGTGDKLFHALKQALDPIDSVSQSRSTRQRLYLEGWLVEDSTDMSSKFYLKYVSLEAHTVCNQACYFCPVSVDRREDHFMSTEFYERIVRQLSEHKDTIEGVAMINYNEPTADKRFVDQVRMLKSYGLPPAVFTNATGLTPARVDAIMEMGGLSYMTVNFSTMDAERYAADRGRDHGGVVMRNLEYVKDRQIAELMDLAVLGRGDDQHKRDFEEISRHFAGSCFNVKYFEVMDRAGNIDVGLRPAAPHTKLRGCDNVGSRPVQHVHITPFGKCILCCEDYTGAYEVGDLSTHSLNEVLSGPEMSRMRRWTYGLEEAPDDFICRHCIFARPG